MRVYTLTKMVFDQMKLGRLEMSHSSLSPKYVLSV